jgi:hypothetical protein
METDTRHLHKRAKAAYGVWAEGMNIPRVWDELKTYEQVAWRDVVRAVSEAEPAKRRACDHRQCPADTCQGC